MKEEMVEADVLCVGGGIAGLMAAINAAESGARVVVADKANTLHSGAGATGNDHFRCYIPEFHGTDMEPVVKEVAGLQICFSRPIKWVRTWLGKCLEIIKLWDSWGIPMKHNGKWEFAGHAFPGGTFTALKYAGQNQKPILTREARKRGVKIVNRVMVFELLHYRDKVIGAIGVDTRSQKLVIFKAKSIILGTGTCSMLYPGPTPGWTFNRADPPTSTGDGRAMAYRAGAALINMEIPKEWSGPKYFARCGKATWIGIIKDPQDNTVGPFLKKPDRRYGDVISDTYPALFNDYTRSGRGPVYMDCRGISKNDYEYMMYGLTNEGNTALINHLNEEGVDVRKNAVEFMTYELTTRGGIDFNEKAETSLKGLYAAGDEYFGGISCAATFGWIAGENAAKYARKVKSSNTDQFESQIKKTKDLLNKIRDRNAGATWQEVNVALQQIMQDYAGHVRTESMLRAGLSHIQKLKIKAYDTIMARNQHELIHCLEILNLLDIGEIVFRAIMERQETRGKYSRQDYPFINPLLNNKVLICKKVNNKLALEWREMKS
jgi:succinate dehydrogenase/fumarate reductase flavoprotein subunit